MADIGYGTTVAFGSFSGELRSVSWDGIERAEIDVTHMQSTSEWMEFIPGLKNAGEITLNVIFDPSETPPIETAAGTVTVTFPDSTVWTCTGFVKSVGNTIPHDELMEQDIGIKLTGVPVFGA